MTAHKYASAVKDVITEFDPSGANRYFFFGSSVKKNVFGDIDVAVTGNKTSRKNLSDLRDRFYDSPIPYKVDVVDFDSADEDFRNYVLQNEPIVWLD